MILGIVRSNLRVPVLVHACVPVSCPGTDGISCLALAKTATTHKECRPALFYWYCVLGMLLIAACAGHLGRHALGDLRGMLFSILRGRSRIGKGRGYKSC